MQSLSEVGEEHAGGEGGEEDQEYFVKTGYIIVLALLIVYTMAGSFIESTKCKLIHETGVAILVGMLISLIAMYFGYTEMNNILEFSESLFFYVCLPPIVFSAGYNMKRKKFFQHFNYVALFGIAGTFACFVLFSILTSLLFYIQPMEKYIPETGLTEEFRLTMREILLLCSLM